MIHKNVSGLCSALVVGSVEDFCVAVFSFPQLFSEESKKYFGGDSGLSASWERFRKKHVKPVSNSTIIDADNSADFDLHDVVRTLTRFEFVDGLLNMHFMEKVV
jgi:hypothetical protein